MAEFPKIDRIAAASCRAAYEYTSEIHEQAVQTSLRVLLQFDIARTRVDIQ